MRRFPVVAVMVLSLATPAWSQWTQHNVTDHLRGTVGTGVSAQGKMEDRYGDRPAELTINCSQNSTTVYMGRKGLFFGTSGGVRVEYTLNGGAVQKASWSVCTSHDCAGLWNGAGIPFIKSMFEKVLLRITIHRSFAEAVNGTFAIAGLAEAAAPVGKMCGWLPK